MYNICRYQEMKNQTYSCLPGEAGQTYPGRKEKSEGLSNQTCCQMFSSANNFHFHLCQLPSF